MKRILIIVGLLAFLSGCGALHEESQAIDPPPENWSAEVLSHAWEKGATQESRVPVVLYAKDALGYAVPYQAEIPVEDEGELRVIQKTLEYMIAGGPGEALLPDGFSLLLPAGTIVNELTVKPENKLAIVDVSKEFSSYPADQERKMLEALTWALTEFKEIDQVELHLDGVPLQKMPVAGWPLSAPLDRVMGINIEREVGIHLAKSMPIMLYFQNKTGDGEPYYVPVTRLVDLTRYTQRDLTSWETLVVVDQLIKGPAMGSRLQPVFPAETVGETGQVQIIQEGSSIAVSFPEELLMGGKTIPQEIMTPIMLSLEANVKTHEVSIGVENSSHEAVGDPNNIPVFNPFTASE